MRFERSEPGGLGVSPQERRLKRTRTRFERSEPGGLGVSPRKEDSSGHERGSSEASPGVWGFSPGKKSQANTNEVRAKRARGFGGFPQERILERTRTRFERGEPGGLGVSPRKEDSNTKEVRQGVWDFTQERRLGFRSASSREWSSICQRSSSGQPVLSLMMPCFGPRFSLLRLKVLEDPYPEEGPSKANKRVWRTAFICLLPGRKSPPRPPDRFARAFVP
jgi:hypothetical protein